VSIPPEEVVAVERKGRKPVAVLAALGQLVAWRNAYTSFVRTLSEAAFRGVVFDYDGTICDEADRETGLSANVGHELSRILRAGYVLGVATGRGKSVKETLRQRIPMKYWGGSWSGIITGVT
jgi:hypothetical protein